MKYILGLGVVSRWNFFLGDGHIMQKKRGAEHLDKEVQNRYFSELFASVPDQWNKETKLRKFKQTRILKHFSIESSLRPHYKVMIKYMFKCVAHSLA